MIFQPQSLAADGNPDDASLRAMKAALRDLKVVMRTPRLGKEHPRRPEILAMLDDARSRVDRINELPGGGPPAQAA